MRYGAVVIVAIGVASSAGAAAAPGRAGNTRPPVDEVEATAVFALVADLR